MNGLLTSQLGVDHQQAPQGVPTFSELLTYSPGERVHARPIRRVIFFFWSPESPGQVSTISVYPAQLWFDLYCSTRLGYRCLQDQTGGIYIYIYVHSYIYMPYIIYIYNSLYQIYIFITTMKFFNFWIIYVLYIYDIYMSYIYHMYIIYMYMLYYMYTYIIYICHIYIYM